MFFIVEIYEWVDNFNKKYENFVNL